MTDILDLPGWQPIATRTEGGELIIQAEYNVLPDTCEKCGVIGRLYKHGPKNITLRDSPIRGQHVRIEAVAKRYKCRDCGGTFIQSLGGVSPLMRMTERCVQYIETQCLRDTFSRIAEHVGCDDKTVRNVAGGYIDRLNYEYRPKLPEWLGIDETQIDGKLRCIITDVANRAPIDMLPDRDKPLVMAWLHQFKERGVVKGLAIDMWRPYKDAAQAVFPGLPVVVDKFHLVRMANRAMDDIRITLAKDQEKAVGRDWMRRKALLRMRYKNLDEQGRFNLQMWLDNEPHVATAYRLKEAFYDIYDAPSRADAAQRLDDWRKSVPPDMRKGKKSFMPLLTSTRNWREEMLAYFDHPISNGYTEALNGVAKVINRAGRGYSFEVLRARLLFQKAAKRQPVPGHYMSRSIEYDKRHAELVETLVGNRCQSCFGVFEPDELMSHPVPLLPGERRKRDEYPRRMYMCPDCYQRFHTERASHGSQHST
ncbi:ISL3 family transposase [Burkholderia cenocepacia]|uniref:ISL3 family transposase n=1 Tax=Burkholderia cenocepacia TaxID=95486 RepID=UPI002873FCF2|nr:ISL3 family transposase [Burkholderia cenocepacia]MDS0801693.1 ISL3 family transposase [Burkholderia cenocepacia]